MKKRCPAAISQPSCMKKEDIRLEDIQRILLGNAPPEFLLEVFFRTLLVFVVLLVVVRILGKRMKGQLTITEMAVMITLGAIVSVPMQMPERGILQGLLILIVILMIHQGVTWLGVKSRFFEQLTQGQMSTLVKDGIMQLGEMKKAKISRQELFAMVREKNIYHLGRVDRLYIEACGLVGIYTNDKQKPGLPVYPPADKDIFTIQDTPDPVVNACAHCGMLQHSQPSCEHCGKADWVKAIL